MRYAGTRDSASGLIVPSIVVPTMTGRYALADEGSYYQATNPTVGTAITPNAVETSFSDTRGFFVIGNLENPRNPSAKKIYLDRLQLFMSGTAPTATTVLHFAGKRSTISREPTTAANRTLLTPVNQDSASGRQSIARVVSYANAGAMTVPASSPSDPVVFRASIPTSLGITGDEYVLLFGTEVDATIPGSTAVRATAAARLCALVPPVILAAGEWLVIHRWWLTEATNPPAFEFMLAWWERS